MASGGVSGEVPETELTFTDEVRMAGERRRGRGLRWRWQFKTLTLERREKEM
ncbi:hypothetical protein LOK49_LG05G03196 [Camellia lanceoleosa]|uniref:Uncharacterized protein n=1 Tax=Camellia lanceoleosa TaxID=1840588 RepID=A0ACC0HLC9_9ERIC|nr:hypothetical protein LOK49_LG05G03196 [Camellia lanceoleosa]